MKMKSALYSILTTVLFFSIESQANTVYVESNRGDANSLLSFDMNSGGALTPKAEIPTGGKGVVDASLALGPFDSDQEIIVNRDKTLLFAVNSGSNSIAVFHISKNGELNPVKNSPFYSFGVNPVSLGLKGDILTVVNKHQDPAQAKESSLPNYVTFRVSADGELSPTGSVLNVAAGSSPSQALVAPCAPFIFGADFLGGLLRSIGLDHEGHLREVSTVGLPPGVFPNENVPRLPLGLAAHPMRNILYVGFPTVNTIGVYKFDNSGHLKFLKAIKDSGAIVCWLMVSRDGRRLYASNTGDPSVTVYDITRPEAPRELQKLMLNSKGGAYQFALSPDEKHLVVVTQRFQASTPQGDGNELHVLNVNNSGTLSEIVDPTPLNLPENTRPQGVLIF